MEKAEKTPDWIVGDYPPLKKDLVGSAAVAGQIVNYPKIARDKVDPTIDSQQYGIVGIKLFSEPRTLKSGKKVYGFFKLRGNYPTDSAAKKRSEDIVKSFDSYTLNLVGPVGFWLPITEETGFCKDTINVDSSDYQKQLDEEKKQEYERIVKELNERTKELKERESPAEGDITLDYYTMKQVTLISLVAEEQRLSKIALPTVKEKIKETMERLATLDVSHPHYKDEWVENWNKERRKAGIADYVAPTFEPNAFVESKRDYYDVIVAVDDNGNVIKECKNKNDLLFFKNTTSGKDKCVIMGRKTWDTIPKRCRPLPDRLNIVISTTLSTTLVEESLLVAKSFEEALEMAKGKEVYIIGGPQVYNQSLDEKFVKRCRNIYVTVIHGTFETVGPFKIPQGYIEKVLTDSQELKRSMYSK